MAAKGCRNLPDMGDLFHGGANKGRQAFPLRLTNDSQAATKFTRRIHRRIRWKGRANLIQPMIEREIICYRLRQHPGEAQRLAILFDVNCRLTDGSDKSTALFLPVKNLTGIERHCEIKIRCSDLTYFHCRPS